ncbi:MAG TPA: winged helix DNA-binding protein [Candidatus Treponema faecavium]|nr:winged helix DNA-binding protein [Candidatus Treponema faecavium]
MTPSEQTNMLKMISVIYRKTQMYLTDALSPYGLTSGLATFVMITCEHGAMVQNQFCELLDMSKGTVAKSLAKLEELGYVLRAGSSKDARSIVVRPTQKAISLYPAIKRAGDVWTKQLADGLSPDEQESLFRLLDKSTRSACAYFDRRE